MVFRYMVAPTLLPLVWLVSRLPPSSGTAFASILNTSTAPFDQANYWGTRLGARVYNRHRMERRMVKTAAALTRRLSH